MENETYLRHFFENAVVGFVIARINDDIIIDINQAATQQLGLSADNIIGKQRMSELYGMSAMEAVRQIDQDKHDISSSPEVELAFPDKSSIKLAIIAKAFQEKNLVESVVIDITATKNTLQELVNSRNFFDSIINGIVNPIFVKDTDHKFLLVNNALAEKVGLQPEDFLGKTDYEFFPKKEADVYWRFDTEVFSTGEVCDNEEELTTIDGVRTIHTFKTLFTNPTTNSPNLVGTIIDITEKRRVEETLRRSQKMDAVGQLTGGIAHDFNNILSIITGHLEGMRMDVSHDQKVMNRIDVLEKSTQRAVDLTQQLLAFSRNQPTEHEVVNINQSLEELDDLIKRSLTPGIETEYLLDNDLWLTEINRGDFQDALLNLVLNAKDAMSNVGKLTIETLNKTINGEAFISSPAIEPGDYVLLVVSDTGSGIERSIIDRIFEPFFTTKGVGVGNGLGLSMVYGFASRSGGTVKVYSEPNIGSSFHLYLPRVKTDENVSRIEMPTSNNIPRGTETLLVVDDEAELLALTISSLEQLGYRVLSAENGPEALKLLESDETIDLLFSDVVMPGGMNGYELGDKAQKRRPDLAVLLTSGYTDKAIMRNIQMHLNASFLNKPYTQRDVAQRIRELLDDNHQDNER